MNFREFDAEIRKNEIIGAKPLYSFGNFFANYYFSKTGLWVAVVVVNKGIVKGCIVVSNSYRKRTISTINTTPIKPFSEIIRKHTETVLNKNLAIHVPEPAAEAFAKIGAGELLKEMGIIELPKIARLKHRREKNRFALPSKELVEKVAVHRGKVLCPNCEEDYLYFKGKVEGKAIIGCKYCEICYYKKL